MGFPGGWYGVAKSDAVREGSHCTRQLLGSEISVAREGSTVAVHASGDRLVAREACGVVLAWFPRGAPTFQLPWERLADPRWRYVEPFARTVTVDHQRPFADYFDHWHTRHVHGIPYELKETWFDGPRCGVSWEARLTPWHLDRFGRLPRLRVSSRATLYGLGFAVDELTQPPLRFVNVQTNTPVDDGTIEMMTVVGIRTPRPVARLAGAAASLLMWKIRKEIRYDLAYWRRCARQPIARDEQSTRDMERFRDWCATLDQHSGGAGARPC
jgi:hypothetical protein